MRETILDGHVAQPSQPLRCGKGWCELRLSVRLALLILALQTASLTGKELIAPVLPGGITDSAGRTGFLSGPGGTLEAVDLLTGDVLWTADARKPLFAYGERLYALTTDGTRTRVRTFDIANRGERVFESDPLTLPDWVKAFDGHGLSFKVRCRIDKGELMLSWEARLPREDRQAAGSASVNLRSGEVKTTAAEVALGNPVRSFARELEKLTVRWQGVSGKELKALVLEQETEQQRFVLHSWDLNTGKANPPRELIVGRRLTMLPTVDERYLFLRDGDASPVLKPEAAAASSGWSIVSTATDEVVARAPYEPGTQAVGLIGPRVYVMLSGPIRGPISRTFMHPRSLRAIDLKTGKKLWERPIEGKSVTPPARV
jgi:hypothetical protein